MSKKGIKLIIFLILLLTVKIVISAPPITQEFIGGVGLEIENPLVNLLQQNRDILSHIHVFNASNGLRMDDTTTSCQLDIYNETGIDIFNSLYQWNGAEFDLNISGGNFSTLGYYSFLIQCNTSTIGGFVKGKLRVTQTGEDLQPLNIIGLILGLGLLGLFFIYFAFKLEENHFILKLLLILFSLITMWVMPSVILSNAGNISSPMLSFLKIITAFFYIFIVYFFIYIFYYWAISSKKMVDMITRGKNTFKRR